MKAVAPALLGLVHRGIKVGFAYSTSAGYPTLNLKERQLGPSGVDKSPNNKELPIQCLGDSHSISELLLTGQNYPLVWTTSSVLVLEARRGFRPSKLL